MEQAPYVAPTGTYYGLATSTYMDTRRTRHISTEEYESLNCNQLAGFEFEADLDNDARSFLMNGRTPATGNTIDFEPVHLKYQKEDEAYAEALQGIDDIPF